MFVVQRELGVVMVEARIFPCAFVVAGFAFLAQSTPVAFLLLVFFVAGKTLDRQFLFVERTHFRQMASVALGCMVFASQHVMRVLIVIENQVVPLPVGMARLALGAVAAFVAFLLIVFFVACVACQRGVLETFVAVAFLAFHVGMFASGKTKFGLFMVKFSFLPVALVMAVFALFAEAPFVNILLSVAVIAQPGGFTEFGLGQMATGTFEVYLLVRSLQVVIGFVVVEFFLVEYDKLGVAPFVLGMAETAVVVFQTSMHSGFGADVLGDVFMAVCAKSSLGAPVHQLVAFAAFIFIFGMALDHRTRHDDFLDRVSRRPGAEKTQQGDQAGNKRFSRCEPQ